MDTRKIITALSSVVLIPAAAIANGKALWELATGTHWDSVTAVLLPLSLDGLAALSVYMWRKGNNPSSRKLGKWLTLSAMVVSAVGAAGGHLIQAGKLEDSTALVVAVGTLPAIALVCFIELLVLDSGVQVGKGKRKQSPEAPKPEPVSKPEQPKVEAPSLPKPRIVPDGPTDEERVRAIVGEYGQVSRNRLQELLRERYGRGMQSRKAGELLAQVREQAA